MQEFDGVILKIKEQTELWEPRLSSLPEDVITCRQNGQGRNIKQITGHMADSASNNTHRIIHLQYGISPLVFPDYAHNGNNDRWITIQNYHTEDWNILVSHWKYSNLHLAHVIHNVDPSKLGSSWISGGGVEVTLRDMISDYPRHLQLHLEEI